MLKKLLKYARLLLPAALLLFCVSCVKQERRGRDEPLPKRSEALAVMESLWKTSPADADLTLRKALFTTIQGYADALSASTFKSFLTAEEWLAGSLVKSEDILCCYDAAFGRVLEGVKNVRPSGGEVHLYHLYNMGYVVKTPSGCFGVDLFHRRAAELEPYLDFICITHIHQDHKSEALIEAMMSAGKPVVQNFLDTPGYEYTSTAAKDYAIGGFKIHSFITSHNNDAKKNVPVTVFQISCGEDSGGFTLMHSGDSNFTASQYDVTSEVDVYIPRYAPNELSENNVIGKVFTPGYVLLSHILELSHTDPDSSRWTLQQGLARAARLDCANSYLPFWGEKLIWKNGMLK